MSVPKYVQVADRIRAQIAGGMLLPGQPSPSGAALSRATGYSTLTCRRALRTLIRDGVLVPGTSPGARPRVASPVGVPSERTRANAARALSGYLARQRRAAGLTQPELAALIGVSVTTVGHAETGRLWQSRRFWQHADEAVSAGGELLALYDAHRAATVAAGPSLVEHAEINPACGDAVTLAVAVSGPVACVTITWADGTISVVCPPETL